MEILALHYSSSTRHRDAHSLKYGEESAVQHFARVKICLKLYSKQQSLIQASTLSNKYELFQQLRVLLKF